MDYLNSRYKIGIDTRKARNANIKDILLYTKSERNVWETKDFQENKAVWFNIEVCKICWEYALFARIAAGEENLLSHSIYKESCRVLLLILGHR